MLLNKFSNLCPSPFTLGYMFGNMLLNLFGNVASVKALLEADVA